MKNSFGGTGSCPWITLELRYHMHRGCSCQTSEVNSELSTTPVVEISTTEEGKATPERVRSDTDADTATFSLSQCPRTCCPRKPGQNKKGKNKKGKNKKSKINGIRNPALETNGNLFAESNDAPVSHPECRRHYHECYHSEEFPCGDGQYPYCDSHGAYERDYEFIRGEAEGAELLREIFELEPGHSVESLCGLCLQRLTIALKNPKRNSYSHYTGFFHGALRYLTTLKKQLETRSCNEQLETRS